MNKQWLVLLGAALLLFTAGCKTEHRIEVAPMELNINVNIRVDRALDDFFGDLDAMDAETEETQAVDSEGSSQ